MKGKGGAERFRKRLQSLLNNLPRFDALQFYIWIRQRGSLATDTLKYVRNPQHQKVPDDPQELPRASTLPFFDDAKLYFSTSCPHAFRSPLRILEMSTLSGVSDVILPFP